MTLALFIYMTISAFLLLCLVISVYENHKAENEVESLTEIISDLRGGINDSENRCSYWYDLWREVDKQYVDLLKDRDKVKDKLYKLQNQNGVKL